MHRKDSWLDDLAIYINQTMHKRFRWGSHDCIIFATGAVEAMTGVNVIYDLQGYRNTREALKALMKYSGRDLEGACVAVAEHHKIPEIPPDLAGHTGDIVLLKEGGFIGETLALCYSGFLFAPGEKGLMVMSDEKAVRAWRLS